MLIPFAADEDLDGHVVRGVRRYLPSVDIVRAQDAGLRGAADRRVLEWAAEAGRVLISHDASTMTAEAYARIARGDSLPGVIIVPQWLPIGEVVADLVLIAECSDPRDWLDQVRFLPLA